MESSIKGRATKTWQGGTDGKESLEPLSGTSSWSRKYLSPLHTDITEVYARDLRKVAHHLPRDRLSRRSGDHRSRGYYSGEDVACGARATICATTGRIVPGLVLGFIVTGLIMQYFTAGSQRHSTEEIIRSYHEHEGKVDMRAFLPNWLAAVTTVGFGGSAALEGPSIYGGGGDRFVAVDASFGDLRLTDRDRRIMLICGRGSRYVGCVPRAAHRHCLRAGDALPRRPGPRSARAIADRLGGVVRDAQHLFWAPTPLFDFSGCTSFTRRDLYWSALLGLALD